MIKTFSEFIFSCKSKLNKLKNDDFRISIRDKKNMSLLYDFIFNNSTKFIDEIRYIMSTDYNINSTYLAMLLSSNNITLVNMGKNIATNKEKYELNGILEEMVKINIKKKVDRYEFLINLGAEPDGLYGMIFAQACKYNNMIAVKLFVEKYNVDVNTRNGLPVMLALKNNNFAISKYLIEHGADLTVKQSMPIKMIKSIADSNKSKEGDEIEWLKNYLHS